MRCGRSVCRASTPIPMFELQVERPFDPSDRWFREVCAWLQRPVGAAGTIGWPFILVPDVIDCRFRAPDEAVLVYHRVEWVETVPCEPFDIGASVEWTSIRGRSVELGTSSHALLRGREVARALLVTRAEGQGEPWGERDVPGLPNIGPVARHHSVVVTEDQVRTFATLAGKPHPLHDDVLYAQKSGFPTVLVQGVVLLVKLLQLAGPVSGGRVEMWFKRPVPAGSPLEICRSEMDAGLWVLRLVGAPEASVVARLEAGP